VNYNRLNIIFQDDIQTNATSVLWWTCSSAAR